MTAQLIGTIPEVIPSLVLPALGLNDVLKRTLLCGKKRKIFGEAVRN